MATENSLTISGQSHPQLGRLVFGIDHWLRERQHVFEYSQNPECIFRIQIARNEYEARLQDGTLVRPGDRIINLHLWNEHIPFMGDVGVGITWALHMSNSVVGSLQDLARYLSQRRECDDIIAICADMALTWQGGPQLVRICRRYGFEPIPDLRQLSLRTVLHRAGENIFLMLMVIAKNGVARRRDVLLRSRTRVMLSRKVLDRRYGARGSQSRPSPVLESLAR